MARPKFDERKAKAADTAIWLQAQAHRAEDNGAKEVMVKVADLKELTAFIASCGTHEEMAKVGNRFGYAQAEEVRGMLGGQGRGAIVRVRKSPKYNVEIFYRDLPEIAEAETTDKQPGGDELSQILAEIAQEDRESGVLV